MSVNRRVSPPPALVQALKSARRVSLVTHINPDGDGLGSEAALVGALKALGKAVVLANNDITPAQYAFLGLEALRGDPAGSDLCVALDCPVLDRLGERGKAAFLAAPAQMVIDHHVPKEPFGNLVWIADKTAATGEMIEALLPELGVTLTAPMASALYAAVVNDTGCFRHSNTDQFVFELASRLIAAGADSKEVTRRLLDEKPMGRVLLQAKALANLKVLGGGRAALVAVSAADLKAQNGTWEDTDGLAEELRSIAGVEVSAMLREESPSSAKLSMRSKFSFDVNAFASRWGGGGHAKAAGATIKLPLDQALAQVQAALEEALKA